MSVSECVCALNWKLALILTRINEMVNRWKALLLRWRWISAYSIVIFVAFEVFELPDFQPRFFTQMFGTLFMVRAAAVHFHKLFLTCLALIFSAWFWLAIAPPLPLSSPSSSFLLLFILITLLAVIAISFQFHNFVSRLILSCFHLIAAAAACARFCCIFITTKCDE